MLQLYTYFRSSAAYRVRIALNLKGLPFESIPVHLVRHGGEQHGADYARINPAHLIPALVDGDDTLSQSLAIIEYLEETHPTPALLPLDAADRARVRALAQTVACEIHPLNNLRVLRYLTQELKIDEVAKIKWIQHWIALGFAAFEAQLAHSARTSEFCHGNAPTLADCCLVPQLYNARRFDTPLEAYPNLLRVEAACLALEAFQTACPEAQPDAV
jgi:maleylacetoacetate isomerase